jgi:ribosomal protein S18 acetylase RimI-like enzyme
MPNDGPPRRTDADAATAIVPLARPYEREWRRLWASYLDFYQAAVAPEVTDRLWAVLLSGDPAWRGFGALAGAELAGFAIVIVHPATWSLAPTAYLEDLFVRADRRGRGIGRALIEAIVVEGREAGWASLYWHTRADNEAARALYDRFTPAGDFVRYRLKLGG